MNNDGIYLYMPFSISTRSFSVNVEHSRPDWSSFREMKRWPLITSDIWCFFLKDKAVKFF